MRFSISIAFAYLASVYAVTDVRVPDPRGPSEWYLLGSESPIIEVQAEKIGLTRFSLGTATHSGYNLDNGGIVSLDTYRSFPSLAKGKKTELYSLNEHRLTDPGEPLNFRSATTRGKIFQRPLAMGMIAIYVLKGELINIDLPIRGRLVKLKNDEEGRFELLPLRKKGFGCFGCFGGSGSN